MSRALVLTAAALGAALMPTPATAYVRSRTTHGTPTAWPSGCALVQPDSDGSIDLDKPATFETIQRTLSIWREATKGCSYFTLEYQVPTAHEAHFDGTNVIKFRADKWCHPDDAQSKGVCYASIAAGITTVFYVDQPGKPDDGRILDADIELNGIHFTFDFVDPLLGPTKSPRAGTDIADLENTLVHELGHLQGLDHTCKDSATPPLEVDENGQPPPDCTKLSAVADRMKITEATMFNSASAFETKKRSPEADDVAGICAIYPLSQDPKSCKPADLSGYGGGSCAFGGRGAAFGPLVFLLVCLVVLSARRRVV